MSQIKFRFQKPYRRIYRVGEVVGTQPETTFSTIQAAINQAVADGFNTVANCALIEIYDKGSPYVENLNIPVGVMLKGMSRAAQTAVAIQGSHTINVTSGTLQSNIISIERINFIGVAGSVNLTLSGSAPCDIRIVDSFFNKSGFNDASRIFSFTNSGTGSIARFINCVIAHTDTNSTGVSLELQAGTTRFIGGRCGIFAGAGSNFLAMVELSGDAVFQASGGQDNTFINGFGQNVFRVNSSSATVSLQNVQVVMNTVTGNIFNSGGTVIARGCRLLLAQGVTTGKLYTGNGIYFHSGNTYAMDRVGTNYIARAAIDQTVDVREDAKQLKFFRNGTMAIARVGWNGFSSISEAATFLLSLGGFTKKKILLAPNVYTEDVTLPSNFILEGDVKDFGLSIENAGSNADVIINGQITVTPSFESRTFIRNLRVVISDDVTLRSPIIVDGADAGTVTLENVFIGKGSNDGVIPTIRFINTNSQSELRLINVVGDRSGSGSGVFCNVTNGKVLAVSCNLYILDISPSDTKDTPLFVFGAGSQVDFLNCVLTGANRTMFKINAGAFLEFQGCRLTHITQEGEIFRYLGNGSVSFRQSSIESLLTTLGASVARDGTQATGGFSFSGNTYAPGDGISINGVSFINGIDFAVGPSVNDTVNNIAAAINASSHPNIFRKVYAKTSGSSLLLFSWVYSATANSYALAVIGTAPAAPSGATMTGGANGSGGNFSYGGSDFVNFLIQSTLTVGQFADTLTTF